MSTEYERLYAALDGACKRQEAYVEAGQMFADNLVDAFADYLKCPRRALALQPEGADVREVGLQQFGPDEAVALRRDGWFGFRITLQLGPVRHISFPVSFQRSGEYTWNVRLTRHPQAWEIAECLDGADDAFAAWVNLATAGVEAMQHSFIPSGRHGFGVEVGSDASIATAGDAGPRRDARRPEVRSAPRATSAAA